MKRWLILALIIILGVATFIYIPKQVAIDKCLDSGGAYDYEKQSCKVSTTVGLNRVQYT